MENYTVPILSENGFNLVARNSGSSVSDNNNVITTNLHHNGDPMLAAGDTSVAIIHQVQNKSQTTNINNNKNGDSSTFTKCIQQNTTTATMMRHHRVDGGVNTHTEVALVGSLCDLKFPNSSLLAASPLNVLTGEPISHLNKDPDVVGSSASSSIGNNTAHELCFDTTTSFPSSLFNRADRLNFEEKSDEIENDDQERQRQQTQQHQQQPALSTTPPQYLTLSSNTIQQTSNNLVQNNSNNNCQISSPPMTVITSCSTINVQRVLSNEVAPITITTTTNSVGHGHKPSSDQLYTIDSQMPMPSVITKSSTNNFTTDSETSFNSTGNLSNFIVTDTQIPINNNNQSTTADDCSIINNAAARSDQYHRKQCEISVENSISTAAVTSKAAEMTVGHIEMSMNFSQNQIQSQQNDPMSHSGSRSNAPQQTQPQQSAAKTKTESLVKLSSLPPILANNSRIKAELLLSQQHNHNREASQIDSSSDCESMTPTTSDDEDNELEFINIDTHGNVGYQDNTSSNSQQSVGGGGGGGGSGGGSGSTANAATGGCGVGGGSGNSAYAVIQGSNNSNLSNNSAGNAGNGSNSNAAAAAAAAGCYMTLLPPAVGSASSSGGGGHMSNSGQSGTSASAGVSSDIIDFKHLFEELCPVCGDKVSGYHYGLLTCESCKGFFKRTVQNKKVYTCVAERSCHIDKTQRKRCPFCRFQKCLDVGMKLEAVRADRMRGGRNKFGPMYKRDRARKLQLMRQRQLALQALRTMGSADIKPTPVSIGYQQGYPNMNIKQEIQIPQVSSLTQSPDSSPSPIAIALGQVNASTGGVIATPNNGSGNGGANNNNNSSGNSGNTNSESVNRSSTSACQDDGIGSLHNASESKICFDSGTHPSSTADSMIEPLRVSPMIREFVQSIDDREWQTQLFALLQKQTYNQVEVDLFELLCKVLDQNLFSQVDWARNTVFFKDLKVDDQMKLLQHSWSDMLVLDHLHQRIHNGLPDETQLNNGQVFNLLSLGLLGVPQLSDFFNELQNKLQDLKFDMGDYVCMKFLILLNPDVRGIINKKTVLEGHENVQAALLDYTLTCYPSVTDKFRRLLNILPEIHAMAARGEEHLYSKHCAGSAPTQTLLMEMLHAKRKV